MTNAFSGEQNARTAPSRIGPEPVPIPKLAGLSVEEARLALERARFGLLED